MNVFARRTSIRQQVAKRANTNMCDKCVELDGKIKHYRRIASMVTDQLTLHRIKELIAQLESRKATLHPAQE